MKKIIQQSTASKQKTRPFRCVTFALLMLGMSTWNFGQNPNSASNFISVWEASPGGTIDFVLPSTLPYDFNIYWEKVGNSSVNGQELNFTSTTPYTVYLISDLTPGDQYLIEIEGTFPQINVTSNFILEIKQWGSGIQWASMANAFQWCSRLELTATDVPDLSNVTDIGQIFENCSSLTGQNANWAWNTSNVTQMWYAFAETKFAAASLPWDVSNVTNMTAMFEKSHFNGDISTWNVSSLVTAINMFTNSHFNQSLGNWTLSSASNLSAIFTASSMDCANYSQTLIDWAAKSASLSDNVNLGNNLSYSTDAQAAVTTLSAKGWTFGVHTAANANPTSINPGVISGADVICVGGTSNYTSSGDAGGTWSLRPHYSIDVNNYAEMNASGVLTSKPVQGEEVNVTIIYNVGGACSSNAYKTVDFEYQVDAGIISPAIACADQSPITFTSSVTGGTWIVPSSNTAYSFDVASGTLTVNNSNLTSPEYIQIGYEVPANAQGCIGVVFKEMGILPPFDLGVLNSDKETLCIAETATITRTGDALSNAGWLGTVSPGFTVNDESIATIDPITGVLTAVAPGTVTISYSIRSFLVYIGTLSPCFDTVVTVNVVVLPNSAGTINGLDELSIGLTTPYTSTAGTGGVWSSDDPSIASVDANTGVVKGESAGATKIIYTVSNACGEYEAFKPIEIKDCQPLPNPGTINGSDSLAVGKTTTYSSNGDANGKWSSLLASILSIDEDSGLATGEAIGTAVITYTVTNSCGSKDATFTVTVTNEDISTPTGLQDIPTISDVALFPNPATSTVNVEFILLNATDILIQTVDMQGRVQTTIPIQANVGINVTPIDISNYAQGIYSVIIMTNDQTITKQLVINK